MFISDVKQNLLAQISCVPQSASEVYFLFKSNFNFLLHKAEQVHGEIKSNNPSLVGKRKTILPRMSVTSCLEESGPRVISCAYFLI